MNCTVYVFGNLGDGYTQYPNDYAKEIFQNFCAKATESSQIAIHRDNNLMYYGYIRKLDEKNQYIGFCILLNGLMLSHITSLFSVFENAVADLVARGIILHFNEQGDVVSSLNNLNEKQQEVERIISVIQKLYDYNNDVKNLPPVSYGISKSDVKTFFESDKSDDIINASCKYGYTFIYKTKNFNTIQLNSFKKILSDVCQKRDEYKKQSESLKLQLNKAKAQQRNTTWVSILGGIVLILGIIIWNKVLYPSEVTHYETGEFVYYGPLRNNKPHGVGVAIYPTNDVDGRKYYIGNFVNGERQDNDAILFYQDGDYYYGSMNGDKWENGVLYMNSDNSHFTGDFYNNEPYNGIWYDHKELYRIAYGVKVQ